MVSISSYFGNTAASQTNAKVLTVGDTEIYFYYNTVIAVRHNNTLVVMKNYWGEHVGKHLHAIDGGTKEAKAARLDKHVFLKYIESVKINFDFGIFSVDTAPAHMV